MHHEHFYVDPKNVRHGEIELSEEETHHLSRVLRKKKGDVIWSVDGRGTAYEAEILYITKTSTRAKILRTRRRVGESIADVTLAQGILKGEKFDWLVEKATELGVRKFIPFTSHYSSTVAGPQKLTRWKRVASAAMKQSKRSILPEINPVKTLEQVLGMGAGCHHRLLAYAGPESTPLNIKKRPGPVVTPKAILVVGPEGGFTEDEIRCALDHSFELITLGPRRLRSETAGIVLSALLLYQLGELE